jgi:hypothetical protein
VAVVSPATVFAKVPAARRRELEAVRTVIRRHVPAGYQEAASGRFLVWQVPLRAYPDTYNGHPLCYVALAAQKHYLSLYLMCAYGDSALARRLREGFKAAGKQLDMGKACIRFKAADDLALDVVADIVSRVPMDRYIAAAKALRRR